MILIFRADGYVSTTLMCRLICNLPELNIRIFNPLASYFLLHRYESNVPADLQSAGIKYKDFQSLVFERLFYPGYVAMA